MQVCIEGSKPLLESAGNSDSCPCAVVLYSIPVRVANDGKDFAFLQFIKNSDDSVLPPEFWFHFLFVTLFLDLEIIK